MNILLLEDDFKLSSEICIFLKTNGYNCKAVYDGLLFFKEIKLEQYDLYILDINVPSLNGLEVCKTIRQTENKIPILMLTAYSDVDDKVQALEYGADDYLVKPFHTNELLARIKALLRRSTTPQIVNEIIYTIDDLEIRANEMKVSRAGKEILLTPKEYKLLELLAMAKGRVISKQTISEKVWDIHFETSTNTIEVFISLLRSKIDKGFDTPLIHTRPGYGYYLKEVK
ncbi:MAG: response regulator transcription factor [Chitinophagaceae bacterium]|nr:response regulator transcription factor [Chitinophagaceae bacterium]MCW5905126.1 response regulator transcription factor [Chitinophagaceae bacterium]